MKRRTNFKKKRKKKKNLKLGNRSRKKKKKGFQKNCRKELQKAMEGKKDKEWCEIEYIQRKTKR